MELTPTSEKSYDITDVWRYIFNKTIVATFRNSQMINVRITLTCHYYCNNEFSYNTLNERGRNVITASILCILYCMFHYNVNF